MVVPFDDRSDSRDRTIAYGTDMKIGRTASRSISCLGISTALSLSVCATAAAEPVEIGNFFARDCVEVSAIVPGDPAAVRDFVPAGFTPSTFFGLPGGPSLPGDPSLLMGIETCAGGIIDGVEVTEPFSFGERVISIDRHDPRAGYHFYAVEQVSDNAAIVDLMSSAGFDITYVPDAFASADVRGGVSRGGPVTIVDNAPTPLLPSPLGEVSIWNERGGTQHVLRLTVGSPTAQAGIGTVTAAENSTIAHLMGREESVGIGAINRFDFHASVLRM